MVVPFEARVRLVADPRIVTGSALGQLFARAHLAVVSSAKPMPRRLSSVEADGLGADDAIARAVDLEPPVAGAQLEAPPGEAQVT